MFIHRHDTAVLLIEPQGERAEGPDAHERERAGNMARLRMAARRNGFRVLVARHYFYATDDGSRFASPGEEEHETEMFIDLVVTLRGHGVRQVILGGMSANICVESRLRDLLELGFSVVVARDATTGPRPPDWGDGYSAGQLDFAFLAHAVRSTDELVNAMGGALAVA